MLLVAVAVVMGGGNKKERTLDQLKRTHEKPH
jgi:hypothetical protein